MREKIVKVSNYCLEGSLLAIIFALPLWFDFYAGSANVFDLNKIILLRALLSLALMFLLINTLAQGKIVFAFSGKIFLLVGLLTASMLASFVLSPDLETAWLGSYARNQGFLTLLLYLVFFLILILKINTLPQINRLITAAVFSSFLVSLYGLIQFSAWDWLIWQETGRVFSTLGQPNFLGHFLVLVIPLTVYLIVISKNILRRFIYLFILLTQIACLGLTYSRSAWLALLASWLLGTGYLLFRLDKKYLGKIILLLAAVSLLAVFFLLPWQNSQALGQNAFGQRIMSSFNLESGSVKARLDFWQASLEIIKEMPPLRLVLGYGPDNLSNLFASQYQANWALNEFASLWPDRAHNLLLDTILHFGLLGLLIHLLLIIFILSRAWLFLKTAHLGYQYYLVIFSLVSLLAYFVNNLFSFSTTVGYLYFYFILALLLLATSSKVSRQVSWKSSASTKAIVAVTGAILILTFVFYYAVMPLRADYHYALFIKRSGKNNCSDNLSSLSRAVDLAPDRNFYKYKELSWSIYCLSKASDGDSLEELLYNISYLVDSLPAKSYNLKTLLSVAEAKSFLFFYGQDKYEPLARADFAYLLNQYPNIAEVYKKAAYFELRLANFTEASLLLKEGVGKLPVAEAAFSDDKYRIAVATELGEFYQLLSLAYQNMGEAETAAYYRQQVELLKNK